MKINAEFEKNKKKKKRKKIMEFFVFYFLLSLHKLCIFCQSHTVVTQ